MLLKQLYRWKKTDILSIKKQKAAAQTSSDMGRKIFEGIANDELIHLEVFKKMFEERVGKSEWNSLVESSKKYADMQIFPKDLKEIEGETPDSNEIDALRIAMESEKQAIDYYSDIRDKANNKEVIDIINEIIQQEKNHYKILESEFDHLNKTGFWFEFDYLGGQNF